jgi:hypothetical protein
MNTYRAIVAPNIAARDLRKSASSADNEFLSVAQFNVPSLQEQNAINRVQIMSVCPKTVVL